MNPGTLKLHFVVKQVMLEQGAVHETEVGTGIC
jgi:hypothetical protein